MAAGATANGDATLSPKMRVHVSGCVTPLSMRGRICHLPNAASLSFRVTSSPPPLRKYPYTAFDSRVRAALP